VRTGKGARLDAAQLDALRLQMPAARIHDDLAAFAQDLVHDDRRERGIADEEPGSVYGRLD
jgi:hypothetical protein